MKKHPGLIHTAEAIQTLVARIRETCGGVFAFDTEFIRESTFYPQVEIIQVATRDESWLVDAAAFKTKRTSDLKEIRPLLDLFEDRSILKVLHAAQGDQECLRTAFGVVAQPSIDTAIAASLCGMGDGIGLASLLKSVMGIELKKGHARTNWAQRPLPSHLEDYAHADVEYLVEAWEKLKAKLAEKGRADWAIDQSAKYEDPELYEPTFEQLARRLSKSGRMDRRSFHALLGLMKWREKRVQTLNIPRRWVADDAVLVDIAQVKPKDVAHLSTFRGLNKGEIQKSGQQIIEIVREARETDESALPELVRGARSEIPTPGESQAMDLLKCYVGILADQHDMASRHILTSAQLVPLLRAADQTVEQWVEAGLVSPHVARIMGEDLRTFLRGEKGLTIARGNGGAASGRARVKILDKSKPGG